MTIKFVLLLCLLSLTFQMSGFECNVSGCLSCDAPNVCEVCQDDYLLQNLEGSEVSTCIPVDCPQNCASCDSFNQCEVCSEGFQLSSSGKCLSEKQLNPVLSKVRILEEVIGNQTDGTGNQTEDGNYTTCTLPGCQVCDDETVCTKCKSGFSKNTAGKCISCKPENCVSCSSPDICETCESPLVPSPNGASCFSCETSQTLMMGCNSCTAPNSCGLCQNGLQLFAPEQEFGVCLKCSISNCRNCGVQERNSTTQICKKCFFGFSPSPAGDTCVPCNFPCDTCTQASAPNNCATCYPPLYFKNALANGTCVKKSIAGCEEVNSQDNTKCSKCQPGYNLQQGSMRCVWTCSSNCLACTSQTSCNQCAVGYYLTNNGACSQCQIKGCAICSEDGATCNSCLRGFYLLDGECKVCPGFCAACTSNSTCTELVFSTSLVLMIIQGRTVLALCDSTCITCSNLNPKICLECAEGYYLNRRGRCRKCAGNCRTCDQNDKQKCLSCYPFSFLEDDSCTTCNSKCLTCQSASSPDICTSCRDGSYLSGNDCVEGCPKNCFSCSSATTCIKCLSGYTLFTDEGQLVCAPCVSSCRTCAEGQPAECLDCGTGFYLAGSSCSPCPDNCAQCTASSCTTCSEGFFMTSQRTCASNCILPCSTCSDTNPASCTACVAGYTFNDVTQECVEDLSCDGSCVACPMGYSLKESQCLTCTTARCQSCNADDLAECYSCRPAFYLADDGTCQPCPAQCRTCLSSTGCLTCASGYTRNENSPSTVGGIECVKCNSPCSTCVNTPNFCRSCADGFRFFGWKCGRRFRFIFRIKLLITLVLFNRNYFSLIRLFTRAIRGSDTNAITINSINEGSVDLEGSAAPTGEPGSTQAAEQLKGLDDLIKGGDIAGMPVEESSVTIGEGSVGELPSSSSNKLGIILGICIPLGVLIIVGIIALIVYKKKTINNMENHYDPDNSQKKFSNVHSQDKFEPGL